MPKTSRKLFLIVSERSTECCDSDRDTVNGCAAATGRHIDEDYSIPVTAFGACLSAPAKSRLNHKLSLSETQELCRAQRPAAQKRRAMRSQAAKLLREHSLQTDYLQNLILSALNDLRQRNRFRAITQFSLLRLARPVLVALLIKPIARRELVPLAPAEVVITRPNEVTIAEQNKKLKIHDFIIARRV